MVDLEGTTLSAEERRLLERPQVGGVILFSRNYRSREQVAALVAEIHALRQPPLLVAVDQEGGRVQRFRDGFTRLPAARRFGERHDTDPDGAVRLAREAGWVMAAELRAVGVDLSFAPVLDLFRGVSTVIDDRAFHADPEVVARLARAMMAGMQEAGMAAVGKHFPGHGTVVGDSHEMLPVDDRRLEDIRTADLVAFARLIHYGLPAVMPAHVVYSRVDALPAGYSRAWLQGVLRDQLGFEGAVFSDDLSMAGAAVAGDYTQRARAALDAGCDMLLVCNDPAGARRVVAGLPEAADPVAQARLVRMHGRGTVDLDRPAPRERWAAATAALRDLEKAPELDLGDDGLL